MRPVVLLDHLNVVRAEADVDDRSAGPAGLPLIALAFPFPLPLSSALIVARQIQRNNVTIRPIPGSLLSKDVAAIE